MNIEHGISRRHLLSTVAIAGAALAAGCTALNTVSTAVDTAATQLTADVTTITNGLAGVLPNIQSITGAGAVVVADIQAAVTKGKSLAAQVVTAVQSGVSKAAPIVNEVAGVVGTVSSDIASLGNLGVSMPAWVGDVVTAAKTLIPLALSLAGVAMAGAPATGMSPDQARSILLAAAAKA